nr:PAS domain-containing protein [Sphingobium subterraneum]
MNTAALSAETLAAVFDQSVDCVKLLGLDGSVQWMNGNGLCAMEIDNFDHLRGRPWASFWPQESQQTILAAMPDALSGRTVRFEAFCPTAKGNPRWWHVTVSRVTDTRGQDTGFLAVSRDVTETELARQALVVSAAELRHRLKNTYTMIASLLFGFARGNPEHEKFADDMQSRLVSLSAAQALFSTQDVPCDLATLIPALISPFQSPHCAIAIAPLPAALIEQGQADAIALVLGELAVNSAKHGALAHGGTIDVTAHAEPAALSLIWTEQSTKAVEAQDRAGGQGLKLIDRIVRARKGELTIDWQASGLTVTLRFRNG